MSCVSAADLDSAIADSASDEIHVSPDASDESGDGSLQKPYQSLECAINNSKESSTIHLNDGTYKGEKNNNLTVDREITIIGKSKENTIIDGESSAGIFHVTGRLTLVNLTIMNAYTDENGSAIYCSGGAVNIKNCIFKDCRSNVSGGVVFNYLGSLSIEDTLFENNSASVYGGVLYTLGVTSVKNTMFTKNVLTSQEGVGACIATGGKIDLDGCVFTECYAQYSAGAMLNLGDATVNNCRFERLSTDYTAGAISNHKNMLINNSYFGYNDVNYYAAALLAPPSGQHVTTVVYNSVFEMNHAGYHGAVANNFKNTSLYIYNCAIVGNYLKLNEAYGDFALDENITVQYCWWGKNEISRYYYSPHSGDRHPENINASRWLVMTFTADEGAVYRNEVNKLTVSLKNYFDNETKEIHEYDAQFNIPRNVTFYTSEGILAVKELVNGTATLDYKPPQWISTVYAKVDNQVLEISNFKPRNTAIIANDFEMYCGSSSKMAVKLVRDNGAAISNRNVVLSVGKIKYTAKTDNNGVARFTIKNTAGKYSAKATFSANGYVSSSKSVKVKVLKPTITASKLKVRKNGKFTVTFKDANKNAIKNVKVKFTVNGKTYVKTTNAKGQAMIKLNLKAGKYTVKAGFKSTSIYGTTILTKKVTVTG